MIRSTIAIFTAIVTYAQAISVEGQLLPLKVRGSQGGSRKIGDVSQSKIFLNYGEKVSYPDKKGNFQM
jgi:hypothetical protein